MNDQSRDLADKLAALKAAYGASLPQKIIEIEKTLPDSLPTTVTLAHGLCGAAGMYGFVDMSQTASDLERLCESIIEQGGQPSVADVRRITELINALHRNAAGENH